MAFKKTFEIILSLLACIACMVPTAGMVRAADPVKIIRYPRFSAIADPTSEYILDVLKQAIKSSGQPYQLQASNDSMQQARAIYELTSSMGVVDVLWTMTTDERETQLIPIRIPIDKGLIGWRVALVTNANSNMLRDVKSINDLSAFSAGQELDWPDVAILKSNGLPVKTSTSYEPLFNMLKAGRFDYFPRSVFEVQNEFDAHSGLNLFIDKNVVIHYPSALYFFVTPRDRQMANDLQNGLEEMIKNGSFERTFQKYLQVPIKNANLQQRTIINLRNPLLNPDKMPLNRPELWFHP